MIASATCCTFDAQSEAQRRPAQTPHGVNVASVLSDTHIADNVRADIWVGRGIDPHAVECR